MVGVFARHGRNNRCTSSDRPLNNVTAVGVPTWPHVDVNGRNIFEDDNVLIEVFLTEHEFLDNTNAHRFTTKPDNRVLVFGGDGHYSEGLVNAAKDADVLFVEGITRKNIKTASWGGDTEEETVKVIGAYHMFPSDLKKLQDDSGLKNIVTVHVQNYNTAEDFDGLSVLQEMIGEGVTNILQASDGDLYLHCCLQCVSAASPAAETVRLPAKMNSSPSDFRP